MKIYYYDKEGIFIKEGKAHLDPLETEKQEKLVYLLPAKATKKKPPVLKEGEAAVFNGKTWTKKPDFRGAVYYEEDGRKVTIRETGKVLPPNAITTPPPEGMQEPGWENGKWVEKFIDTPKKSHLTEADIAELKAANTIAKLRSFIEKYLQV
ncbi:MAG: hypothetical protein DRP09_16440 [Candidatus Thorarchaeota archaeon]|nr:MAG: hypothetical protein DRP09_16440 [Candidatus Thorarchaeota archaeon]